MKERYYYVACEANEKDKVNDKFKHYFRLYKENSGKPILVDQGLSEKIETWKQKFKAEFNTENPYPQFD
jgi:hypothetical protein